MIIMVIITIKKYEIVFLDKSYHKNIINDNKKKTKKIREKFKLSNRTLLLIGCICKKVLFVSSRTLNEYRICFNLKGPVIYMYDREWIEGKEVRI